MFATTNWSLILEATTGDSSAARRALGVLCQSYWPPVYAFIRSKGLNPTDAEDLTQAYFTRFLDKGYLHDFRPEIGRFRTFLRASVAHFLSNEWDRERAQKRGGGQPAVPLDDLEAVEGRFRPLADHVTPEVIFEREWASALLGRCLARLREEHDAKSGPGRFEALKPFLIGGGSPSPDYGEAAGRLGLRESSVRVAVHRLRKRFSVLLREEVARTVSDPSDVDAEIRSLLAVVQSVSGSEGGGARG